MRVYGKRTLIGLAVAVGLLLSVGLRVLLRRPQKGEQGDRGVAEERIEVRTASGRDTLLHQTADPAAPVALPHLDLNLAINFDIYPEVIQSTPLLLTVTLCHLDAKEAEDLRIRTQAMKDGRSHAPPDLIGELRADWEKRLASLPAAPVKLTATGEGLAGWLEVQSQSGEQWSEVPWALETIGTAPVDEIEVGTQKVQWELAVSPTDAASIAPGELNLRVYLKARMEPEAAEKLVSQPRRVRVVAKDGASPETALSSAHLTGRYYLGRGDFAVAERFAREGMALAPNRVKSWVLLGEVKEGQSDPDAALEAYSQAINLIAESGSKDPPPEFLIKRRQALLWRRIAEDSR